MSTQAEIEEVAEDSGVPVKVVQDFCKDYGYEAEDFQDHFMGVAEDGESWIEEWYYDTGEIDKCPDPLKSYIEWKYVWRDMTFEGWFGIRSNGDFYIFSP